MSESVLPALVKGTTKHYKGNGRRLGYPTANIETPTNLGDGVYFGWADLANYKHWPALIFVGTPSTATLDDGSRRVEAHLLDAKDIDYYGFELKLDVQVFHRSNQTFDSVDELLVAMKSDEVAGRTWATL